MSFLDYRRDQISSLCESRVVRPPPGGLDGLCGTPLLEAVDGDLFESVDSVLFENGGKGRAAVSEVSVSGSGTVTLAEVISSGWTGSDVGSAYRVGFCAISKTPMARRTRIKAIE